jgi:ABC-2 type transport system ATP-binding protein
MATMDGRGAALRVRGLSRRFGEKVALSSVDLTIRAGEIHALLGPNGAGKTTLIRVLCGLVDPHEGEIALAGTLGLVPSGDRTFYLRISGVENLIFFGRLHGLRLRAARERAHGALAQVGLASAADLPVGRYSHGMQKRLSVARALLADPAVLLVDEATHDLDPDGARRVRTLVAELAQRGAAVLWTTQRIEEIRGFAQTVTFLREGKVRFAGTVAELIAEAPRNNAPRRPGGEGAWSGHESSRADRGAAAEGAVEEAFFALLNDRGGDAEDCAAGPRVVSGTARS